MGRWKQDGIKKYGVPTRSKKWMKGSKIIQKYAYGLLSKLRPVTYIKKKNPCSHDLVLNRDTQQIKLFLRWKNDEYFDCMLDYIY